jgi:hypothetical protein
LLGNACFLEAMLGVPFRNILDANFLLLLVNPKVHVIMRIEFCSASVLRAWKSFHVLECKSIKTIVCPVPKLPARVS